MGPQTVFLVFLSAGIISLVGAIGAARWNWRKGIPPFGLDTKVIQVLLHPERYTQPQAIPFVRVLGLAGSVFLAVALAAVGYQLATAIR